MDDNKDDNEFPVYSFGWWPEVVGVAGVALLIWFLITFANGSI